MSLEQHYPPSYWAQRWGVSRATVTSWFEDEPGVLKYGTVGSVKKRKKVYLRIPLSVAERVYKQRTQ